MWPIGEENFDAAEVAEAFEDVRGVVGRFGISSATVVVAEVEGDECVEAFVDVVLVAEAFGVAVVRGPHGVVST